MYKLISRTFLAVAASITLFSCSDNNDFNETGGETIEVSALPEASRATLNTYFNEASVTSAKKSSSANIYGSIYSALLSNGFEIDFNENGLWTEIESEKNLAIPTQFLQDELPKVQTYLAANYANNVVVEIERERYGFTIELNNGIDLVFDQEQNLIGVDLDEDDDDEVRITFEELPENSRTFINTRFEGATAVTVKKETDDNQVSYDVYLNNGIKIEFDAAGNWTAIESKGNVAIPSTAIPAAIAQYLVQQYAAYVLTEIEINDNGGFTVEIENRLTTRDMELIFDANGNFLRLDD
ncbi:PepSY-like domain-containing protein [Sphingobacterium oryzagri]|uniref:PepSY-like domain-containing protein n=1 Tax=Sphingobacterium oryzagri TaxID=3025669 RepID=A0ABY7WFW7_9SPHI|nr:PepSY-like domain-containing protein [Sphingobacterium sp. KACC 22765]WDF67509.1 PepSY-like domain-containing protein [Sphingobacterium sp. KACC 22765]